MYTLNAELERLAQHLVEGVSPEAVFGKLPDDPVAADSAAKGIFHKIALVVHPDKFHNAPEEDKKLAELLFKRLKNAWEKAKQAISEGRYGKPAAPVHISSKVRDYAVGTLFATGAVCDVFRCTFTGSKGQVQECLLKIARTPADNDLVRNEAAVLRRIHAQTPQSSLRTYFPDLVDSLRVSEPGATGARHANVFRYRPGLWSLEQVIKAYPGGVDPRDMAWMWKRILGGLFCAHEAGIIHGSVLPPHILLDLESHGVVLVDWTCSTKNDGASRIGAIDPAYQEYYPQEVLRKEVATSTTDIYLAAMTIIKLLGGDVLKRTLPASAHKEIVRMLLECTGPALSRPKNAFELHTRFDSLLEGMFGPKKFRKFVVPAM